MGNRKRYVKFQENLFSGNEIKSIFCPPFFRKWPITDLSQVGFHMSCSTGFFLPFYIRVQGRFDLGKTAR